MSNHAENVARFPVCFIHSSLDEAGLTSAQFRVLCHVVRRGTCTASVETMAEVCRMHPDTVWAALRCLESRRMIVRTARFGKTTEITVTNPDSWLPEPIGNEGAPASKGYPSKPDGGTGNEGATTHPKGRGTKVIPKKVIQEGNPLDAGETDPLVVFPQILDTSDFREAWARFVTYRRHKKLAPLLPQSVAQKLTEMASWGETIAIQSINETIANGWQGTFRPKASSPGSFRTPRQTLVDWSKPETAAL